MAIGALGRLKGAQAVDSLIRELGDADPDVRWPGGGRWETNDARAGGALIKALEDDYANVSWSAAEALGIMQDENAVGPLIQLLNNPSEAIMIRLAGRFR